MSCGFSYILYHMFLASYYLFPEHVHCPFKKQPLALNTTLWGQMASPREDDLDPSSVLDATLPSVQPRVNCLAAIADHTSLTTTSFCPLALEV